MSKFILMIIAGITQGVPFYLVGSGLSFTLGVMDILNFSHGVFFMIGAYIVYQLLGGASVGIGLFLLACLGAGVLTGIVGVLTERLILRTTYARDPLVTVLATYGIFLALTGATSFIWGGSPLNQMPAREMTTVVTIGNYRIPETTFWLAGIGLFVGLGLYILVMRTAFGIRVRAVSQDREMSAALGVRTQLVTVVAFFIGTFLAGMAGGLMAGQVSIDPGLGSNWVLYSFLVVVVGGLGSIQGSFYAAMLLGISNSFCADYIPNIQPYIFYIVVVVVLVIKPTGLVRSVARHA